MTKVANNSKMVDVIVSTFPPITFAFSYGSAVTPQLGYSTQPIITTNDALVSPLSEVASQLGNEQSLKGKDSSSRTSKEIQSETGYSLPRGNTKPPMLDMIFAVENSKAWHASNLALNRSHYSFPWQFLGAGMIEAVQSKSGAGIWYNTLVPIPGANNGATMKYGVMSVDHLLDDLLNWKYLYAAGRLHKPVRISPPVTGATCGNNPTRRGDLPKVKFAEGERRDKILAASRENLRHALRAALLMLPSEFSAEDLYTAIAALSYNGDWRMVFGENPHKVSNIVSAQISLFHSLYGPILNSSFPSVSVSGLNESIIPQHAILVTDLSADDVRRLRFKQNTSLEARLALGLSLPVRVQKRMAEAQIRNSNSDEEEKCSTLRSSVSYFVTGLSTSGRSKTTIPQETHTPTNLSPRKRIALVVAEEGRALLSRLQQQRLQVLISNKERWENRMRKVFRIPESGLEQQAKTSINAHDDTSSSRIVTPKNVYLQHSQAAAEIDGTTSLHYTSAIGIPKVLNFWDKIVVHNVANMKEVGLSFDVGPFATRFLKPSIAHIVGLHARTQSIKGILTAGPFKATLYAAEKLQKFFKVLIFKKR